MLSQREQVMVSDAVGGGGRWTQAGGLFIASAGLPALFELIRYGNVQGTDPAISISLMSSYLAAWAASLIFRNVTAFPGTRGFAYIIPAFSITFAVLTALLLWLRVSYVSAMLLVGYTSSIAFTFFVTFQQQTSDRRCYYLVPFGNIDIRFDVPDARWHVMDQPILPADSGMAPIVADLRYDHEPAWERTIAEAAISGRPVYHTKQLRESLTGRVEIEHLSENTFGSLLPNMAYFQIKYFVDLLLSAILLPVLVVPLAIVAVMIKLDSPGPVFFRQQRMGFRGRPFQVLKLRTMTDRLPCTRYAESRDDAITSDDDKRITRLGKLLRRSRIDELPQLVNVLRGEMSLIGPRPEALLLSRWYEQEIPFYIYRHIVRPGITGWAQVNQGHVADLAAVNTKLHYDLYYIKHFSAWLDILITLRTIATIVSGFGSK